MSNTRDLNRRFTIDFATAKYRLTVTDSTDNGKITLSANDITNPTSRTEFEQAVTADIYSGDMSTSAEFAEALFSAHSGHTGTMGAVAGSIGSSAFNGALGALGAFTRTMFAGMIGMAFSSIYGFAVVLALTVTFGMVFVGFGTILLAVAIPFGLLAFAAKLSRDNAWARFEADKGALFDRISLNLADIWDRDGDTTADELEANLKAPMAFPVHDIVWLGGLTFGVLAGEKEDPEVLSVTLTTAQPIARPDQRQRVPMEAMLAKIAGRKIALYGPVRSEGASHVRAILDVDGEDLGVQLIRTGLALPLEDEALTRVLGLDLASHDHLANIVPASRLATEEGQRERRGIWADAAELAAYSSKPAPEAAQLSA